MCRRRQRSPASEGIGVPIIARPNVGAVGELAKPPKVGVSAGHTHQRKRNSVFLVHAAGIEGPEGIGIAKGGGGTDVVVVVVLAGAAGWQLPITLVPVLDEDLPVRDEESAWLYLETRLNLGWANVRPSGDENMGNAGAP
jgi:hypothetical protein